MDPVGADNPIPELIVKVKLDALKKSNEINVSDYSIQ